MTYFQVGYESMEEGNGEGNKVHNSSYFLSRNVMTAGAIHSLV